jgi:F-box protein 9
LDDPQDPDEKKPLVSALDHYEEAMEKEAQGNMRDSLHLYRRAYRVSDAWLEQLTSLSRESHAFS